MATAAARLIRVSGDTQDERSQVGDCDEVAERENLVFTVPDFQLHAVSGSKGVKKHLDALAAALELVRAGQIQAIVVAHSSRLTRLDPDEADLYALQVRMAGGRVYSHDEPAYGSGDLMGKFSALMAHEQNHEYSITLSGHINRKFRNEIDASGSFRGCPPAGYVAEGEKYRKALVRDSGQPAGSACKRHRTAAESVHDAFIDAATGTGTVELGKCLGMTADAVAKMLRNTFYSTGKYPIHRSDGVTVYHTCEGGPLVTVDEQRNAVAALESRLTGDHVASRRLRAESGYQDFSGALFCPCGTTELGMHRYFNGKPGARVRRYRCKGCGKSVMADNADTAVDAAMRARTDLWMRRRFVPGNNTADELARVKIEYSELSARGLDFDAEDAERDRLRAEIRRLKATEPTPGHHVDEIVTRDDGTFATEGEHWASMSMTERREHLANQDPIVLVSAAPGRTGAVTVELEYEPYDGPERE
jgi:DNA invertase Pin-like site-specific DNA recombinase